MSISLIGIILIQGLWISHAVKTERQAFDKLVYDALKRGIDKAENHEMFMFMNERIELPEPPDFEIHGYDSMVEWHHSSSTISPRDFKLTSKIKTIDSEGNTTVIVFNDSSVRDMAPQVRVGRTITYDIDTENEINELLELEDLHMKEEEFHIHVDSEIFELEDRLDSIQQIIILEAEKERVVSEKLSKFQENIDKWVYEYKFDDRRIEFISHEGNLEEIISEALSNNGINLEFHYQIIKEEADSNLLIKSHPDTNQILNYRYKTELYPGNLFSNSTLLTINFPNANPLIYKSVALLIVGSLIFTIIILLTFGFTLYYIQKQKKISEIKSDFINNMTHEFKTPIATISLASSAIESPKVMGDGEKTSYYIDIIKKENKRMNSQVERVLQMAQIDNHDFNLNLQMTDVHEIIDNVSSVFAMRADESGGKINCSLKASCFKINVDEIHFANVLNNLIDNALKYNDNAPEILLQTSTRNGRFILEVSDNGHGMSKEVQKHAFDKFYRKPSGNIHNIKGFGLGLSYVKAIIEAHGGEVLLDSEPNNGSKFTISLKCLNGS